MIDTRTNNVSVYNLTFNKLVSNLNLYQIKLMKKTCYLLFLVFLCSCDSIDKLISSTDKEVSEKGKDLVSETNLESLHGVWEGFQDSYYMINKFGDYTIINGERVSIPEAEYKFLFEEGNLLSIRQKVEGDYNDFLEYDYMHNHIHFY